jgi:ATP-binding cassette, subfamily B, bacterial HlyB/CyaB
MTVGELVAFNMLDGRVAQPVLRLAQIWQDFHQARILTDCRLIANPVMCLKRW